MPEGRLGRRLRDLHVADRCLWHQSNEMLSVRLDAIQPSMTGEEAGSHALFEAVYARLKAMAGRRLADARFDTLDTTALVHELYLKIGTDEALAFAHPAQFLSYAARAMRHLLSNRARDRMRQRAGGEWVRVTLTGAAQQLCLDSAEQAIEMDEGLRRLEGVDARAARVVELLYFAGVTLEEAATALGVNRRTVDRDWRFARAFLKAELE